MRSDGVGNHKTTPFFNQDQCAAESTKPASVNEAQKNNISAAAKNHPLNYLSTGERSNQHFLAGVTTPSTLPHPFSKPLGPFSYSKTTQEKIPEQLNQVWFGGQIPDDAVFAIAKNRTMLPKNWRHVIITDNPAEKAKDFLSTLQLIDSEFISKKMKSEYLESGALDMSMVMSTYEPDSQEFNERFFEEGYGLTPDELEELKRLRSEYKRYKDNFDALKQNNPKLLRTTRPYNHSLSLDNSAARTGLGVNKELSVEHNYSLDSSLIRHEEDRSIVFVDGKPIEFVSSNDLVNSVRDSGAIPPKTLYKLEEEMNRQRTNIFALHQKAADIARLLSALHGGLYMDTDIALRKIPDIKAAPGKLAAFNSNNNILASTKNSGGSLNVIKKLPDNWDDVENEFNKGIASDTTKSYLANSYHAKRDELNLTSKKTGTQKFFHDLYSDGFGRQTAPEYTSAGYGSDGDFIKPLWLFGAVQQTMQTTGPTRLFSLKDEDGEKIVENRQSAPFAGPVNKCQGMHRVVNKDPGSESAQTFPNRNSARRFNELLSTYIKKPKNHE